MAKSDGTKLIVSNRRARYDYAIDDTYEAGIMLTGSEVKSLREGKASLAEAWVKIDGNGEAWLVQAHIPEYEYASHENHVPTRDRKLLLHRYQLERLERAIAQKGVTLVPMRLYFREGRAKLEFGVGKGKTQADKRRDIKKRDAEREIDRVLKERSRM